MVGGGKMDVDRGASKIRVLAPTLCVEVLTSPMNLPS